MSNEVDLTPFISGLIDDLNFKNGTGFFYKKDKKNREARIYIEEDSIRFIDYEGNEKVLPINSEFDIAIRLKELKKAFSTESEETHTSSQKQTRLSKVLNKLSGKQVKEIKLTEDTYYALLRYLNNYVDYLKTIDDLTAQDLNRYITKFIENTKDI